MTFYCGILCALSVIVLQHLLLVPVQADILVINPGSNETSPAFDDSPANFGPRFPHRGLRGRIVYSVPADACGPVQAPPGPTQGNIGWILVIARRGKCQFADKVLAAQQKGYDSAIVHNYEGQEKLVKMYGNENGSFINIPSTFVGWEEGMRLKNEYNYTSKKYYAKITKQDDMFLPRMALIVKLLFFVCLVLVIIIVIVKMRELACGHKAKEPRETDNGDNLMNSPQSNEKL